MNKHFQEVLSLAQAGKIDEAFKRCKRLIKKKPREADYLLLAASLHANRAEFSEVIDYCKRAIKLEPKNASALYNISVAYLSIADYENSRRYGRKLISVDKKNASALSNLGLACWHLKDFEQALSYALTAVKLEPNKATTHNNLGLAYKSLDNVEDAIKHFKQAITNDPNLADAYFNCGITLLDNMDDDAGNAYLDKAIKINPNHADLHNYKGLKLLKTENGHTKEAIEHFKTAIAHKYQFIEAYINLGGAYMKDENYVAAEATYRKLIEYQPDRAFYYINLANALLEQENFLLKHPEAEIYYLKAIELESDQYEAHKCLADLYALQGETEKALKFYETYNQAKPDDPTVISAMINVLERCGDFEKAKAILEPQLNQKNIPVSILIAYGKLSKHIHQEKKAITALLSIDDENNEKNIIIEKYQILGKLSQAQKEIDNTFIYYKKANDLEEEHFDYDKSQKQFDDLKNFFTPEKIQTLKRADNNSELPILIVGMPRSGTTLTEQILSSHPDVFGAGELLHIGGITTRLRKELTPKNNFPNSLNNMSSAFASKIANEHIKTLHNMSPQSNRIVDKMPHNFLSLGLINLLFPNATVIHCQRSPIDICLSIYFQHFNKQHAYSNDLAMLGKYYKLYDNLMKHWYSVLDIKIIDFKYENVIENAEEETRRLLEQCRLDWHPECLDFHKNERVVMTPSYDQVRQPLYTSSVAKWKKYEHLLKDLIDSLGEHAY